MLYVCMSVGAHGIQKMVSDLLEVKGSCQSPEVDAGNRTPGPLQEQPLSHLFSSLPTPLLTTCSSEASS